MTGDVLVLCYHAVSPTWDAALSVTPGALEDQLALLARRGWKTASLAESVPAPPHRRTLVITFDDAFASVLTRAAPILDRFGYIGTLFVPTTPVTAAQPLAWEGTSHWLGTAHAAELTPMSWPDITLLRDRGWEIGSHTCTHPKLPQVNDRRLRSELFDARGELEDRLGHRCLTFAYPYGAVDDRVEAAARLAGYTVAVRLDSHLGAPIPLRWPRIGVYHTDDARRFRLKVSPAVRRLRSSALWNRLR